MKYRVGDKVKILRCASDDPGKLPRPYLCQGSIGHITTISDGAIRVEMNVKFTATNGCSPACWFNLNNIRHFKKYWEKDEAL